MSSGTYQESTSHRNPQPNAALPASHAAGLGWDRQAACTCTSDSWMLSTLHRRSDRTVREFDLRNVPTIPPAVASKLGFYVYVYVNPLNDSVFYVGKGKGARALTHLDASPQEKRRIATLISEIRAQGVEPRIDILAHALPSNTAALQVETAAIDLLGVESLTNAARGWGSTKFGRRPLSELTAHYLRRPANIREPAILIRITKLYRFDMSDVELYDATRSAWKVGIKRERAELALAVFEGVVREVYAITAWLPGASTFNSVQADEAGEARRRRRWEFVGTIAADDVRRRYINRYVGHLFTKGAQNPIAYVNIR